MTRTTITQTRPARQRRPGAREKSGWPVPGPQLMPTNPRINASPAPLVVHVVGAVFYAVLGAFQFSARLRRRHPGWHRALRAWQARTRAALAGSR